ncbi:MAG: hypothetical protein PHV17_01990 [Candidatus Omnitrophica bacterium]|nr:hypothetical protein [Candidatus Omnitrophota bacterium]
MPKENPVSRVECPVCQKRVILGEKIKISDVAVCPSCEAILLVIGLEPTEVRLGEFKDLYAESENDED